MPGLEVEYEKFLNRVEEETCDPDWNVLNHPAHFLLNRFPPYFGAWVTWLDELILLANAGYPLGKDDLSILEWKAMAIIKRWHLKARQQDAFKQQTE